MPRPINDQDDRNTNADGARQRVWIITLFSIIGGTFVVAMLFVLYARKSETVTPTVEVPSSSGSATPPELSPASGTRGFSIQPPDGYVATDLVNNTSELRIRWQAPPRSLQGSIELNVQFDSELDRTGDVGAESPPTSDGSETVVLDGLQFRRILTIGSSNANNSAEYSRHIGRSFVRILAETSEPLDSQTFALLKRSAKSFRSNSGIERLPAIEPSTPANSLPDDQTPMTSVDQTRDDSTSVGIASSQPTNGLAEVGVDASDAPPFEYAPTPFEAVAEWQNPPTADLRIQFSELTDEVCVASTPHPWIMVGGTVWNFLSGEKREHSRYPGKPDNPVLSVDGKSVGFVESWANEQDLTIQVDSIQSGTSRKVRLSIPEQQSGLAASSWTLLSLDAKRFLVAADGHAFVMTPDAPENALHFTCRGLASRMAVSPMSDYVAFPTTTSIEIYRTADGRLAKSLAYPEELLDVPSWQIRGQCFSLDASAFAILMKERIVAWNTDGEVILNETISQSGRWTANGKRALLPVARNFGWLIDGKHLYSLEKRKIVWSRTGLSGGSLPVVPAGDRHLLHSVIDASGQAIELIAIPPLND